MVEHHLTALADAVALQLSGLFRELACSQPESKVAAVRLTNAPASGRAVRLYLLQCDFDDLVLVSTLRRFWEVDAAGFRWLEQWPFTNVLVQSAGFGVEFPYIRFAITAERVRFGMRFGPSWYVVRQGDLVDGKFEPANLFTLY